jgi:hypothetical protein
MVGSSLPNLFDDQLIAPTSPLYAVLGTAFVLALTIALFVLVTTERDPPAERSRLAWARRYAGPIVGWSLAGVVCTVCAILTVPFLSKRAWLVATSLGLVATCIRAIARFRQAR